MNKKYVKKTSNSNLGRPKKEIKVEEFEKLCMLQCTKEEIASFFDCSVDTIENFCRDNYESTFSAIYKSKSALGKISLRRAQLKLAEKNATMAIWLGKQYLEQSEKIQTTTNFEDLTPLVDLLQLRPPKITNEDLKGEN